MIYQALDNNGKLICLTVSISFARRTADSHYKDIATQPIVGDEYPLDTWVCDGQGRDVWTLAELIR